MKQNFNPLTQEQYRSIKTGDVIERMLGFAVPMYLNVGEVTEDKIDCGWVFDRNTGIEIDEDIPMPVSYISRILTEEEKKIVADGGKLEPRVTVEDTLRKHYAEICEATGKDKPVTIPQAFLLLKEHLGEEKAIELFKAAQEETKHNIFRTSAYAATLETYVK